ncbi:MAG: hypothetical protein DRG82_06245 [Deltaproteobacteria bacterium]|nr:MAG: hypothetical protein DRG82_06245 [Deltaproteobacteria bacterium]
MSNIHVSEKLKRKKTRTVSAKPVQRRLLIPLGAVFFVMISGFITVLFYMQQRSLNQSSRQVLENASHRLSGLLVEQSRALAALEEVFLRDPGLRDALKDQDRQRLLADYKSIFVQLREKYGITHFYFHRLNRVNLLRVHKPEKHDDLIDRCTALEAERTGKTSSGIELGPLGTFTLRVVHPVFEGRTLIGYLELGKEVEDILNKLHIEKGVELAVTIHKSVLKREKWEKGMEMLGRKADWDRFPDDVLIYSSLPRFSVEIGRFFRERGRRSGGLLTETIFDERTWRALVSPLSDVSGSEVGDLIIFNDVSESVSHFNRVLSVWSATALALFIVLFSWLYTGLRRVDQTIQQQQNELVARERRYRDIAETIADWIWEVDSQGRFTYCSQRCMQILGYSPEEMVGKTPFDFMETAEVEKVGKTVGNCVTQKAPFKNLINWYVAKDGGLVCLQSSGIPVFDDAGRFLGCRGADSNVTERKKVEREKERLISELQSALAKVKTLSGLLPICASCKKIRDDKGYWNQIESYIHNHSGAQFTHSICPDCAKKLYPELYEDEE